MIAGSHSDMDITTEFCVFPDFFDIFLFHVTEVIYIDLLTVSLVINVIEGAYQNIRKLCCGVFSSK